MGIVFVTDVIGHRFNNAQLMADQFAANGYLTVMPDIFDGDAIPLARPDGFDMQEWRSGKYGGKLHDPPHTEPFVQGAIKYLKEQHGVKRIGAVGYCFGAKFVVRGLGQIGGIDVGYTAHPTAVEESELEQIKGPLSISAAGTSLTVPMCSRGFPFLTWISTETDRIFPTEKRHTSEAVLAKVGQPYQVNLFSGVEHGFAVRADISKKVNKFAKEQAFAQAVVWFDTWLKQ